MLRTEKTTIVDEMAAGVKGSAAVLFLDFTGLTVAEADSLRKKYRESKIGYRVFKNTLLARAISDTPAADAARYLKGSPTGVVLGGQDPVLAARLTLEFLKDCKHLRVKGGILDNRAINADQVEALSKMPGKVELQGRVIAQALSAGAKVIGQIKNPAGKIVGALDALVKRLGGEET